MKNNLHSKLRSVWQREQWLHRLGGILALCRWLILLLLVSIVVDWLVDLPGGVRGAVSLTLLAFALHKAWQLAWRYLKGFDPAHTALQVEEYFGGLQSLLVTAVQFGSKSDSGGSSDLRDLACRQAEQKITELPAHETISYQGLRKPAALAVVLIAAVAAFALASPAVFTAAIGRFVTPWEAISYPTRTQIQLADSELVVKEGEPVVVSAAITGEVPANAVIALRTGEGEPRRRKLPITDGACQYDVKAAFRGFEYALSAGDAETEWQRVRVISSPKIKKAKTTVQYPAYTQRAPDSSEALTLTLPEGSIVSWELELNQAVRMASVDCEGEAPIPMTVSADGLTVSATYTVSASKAYSFGWVEKAQGYVFDSPRHFLQMAPDKAPRVEIVSPPEDLYAIVGRQMDLACLARDDYGISAAAVIYRLNNGEEHKTALAAGTIKSGEVSQTGWDYRAHVKAVTVGDILRVGVEVQDHFPSADGPNRTRSRMRRITFLTEDEYLEQLAKRKRRLVAKLRTIYRQARASHDVVSRLSPQSDSFRQTCMLEAVRQNLVQERIAVLTTRIQFLLDDLAANKIVAEADVLALQMLKQQLQTISSTPVEDAAVRLSRLAQAREGDILDASAASRSINTASRQIASLVQQLGVNYATEVLARELQTAINMQSALRLQTLDVQAAVAGIDAAALATQQTALGNELTERFEELLAEPDYSDSAMSAVRLSRMVKDLRLAKVETKMATASGQITEKDYIAAAMLQAEVIDTLQTTLYRLKAGVELKALNRARQQIEGVLMQQQNLSSRTSGAATEFAKDRADLAKAQEALYRDLRVVVLPKIPLPIQSMFDNSLPVDLKPEALFDRTLAGLAAAATAISGDQQDAAVDHQTAAVAGLTQLVAIINQRKDELLRLGEVFTLALNIQRRYLQVGDFVIRQAALLEQTEDALDDDASVVYLAEQQGQMQAEVQSLYRQIDASLKKGKFAGYAGALLAPLDSAEKAMARSSAVLLQNEAEEALGHQDAALALLKSCKQIMDGELGMLSKVASIMQGGTAIADTARLFGDVEAEQTDVASAAKTAPVDQLPRLALTQKNLARCLTELIASLTGPAENLSMQSLLEFSQSSFGSAVLMLGRNNAAGAAPHQEEAAKLLGESHRDLERMAKRNAYVAELLGFIYRKSAAMAVIYADQKQLCFDAQNDEDITVDAILKRQEPLLAQATTLGDELFNGTRQGHFGSTARFMSKAVELLKAGKRADAVRAMNRAEFVSNADRNEFGHLARLVALIPALEEFKMNEAVRLLLSILETVNAQRDLTRGFWLAEDGDRGTLIEAQSELASTLASLVSRSGNHPALQAAHERILRASATSAKAEIYTAQREAESFMHGVVLEMAWAHVPEYHGNGKKKSPFAEPEHKDEVILDTMKKLDKFKIFSAFAAEGDDPEDQETEWQVLARRDRASLNENFARELPLEYRDLLKDYYERLAK